MPDERHAGRSQRPGGQETGGTVDPFGAAAVAGDVDDQGPGVGSVQDLDALCQSGEERVGDSLPERFGALVVAPIRLPVPSVPRRRPLVCVEGEWRRS
ncbi:MAG: hypothetical protein H0W36_03385 [Gemmatimonadetes bacterium]|nr:hypothetical protein [Gemmatimonadota bacterium]